GYTVQMDAEPAQAIQSAGTVRYADITPGAHTVQLAGLAANCAVAEQNPRSVDVPAGETARITFAVTCGPTTGGVQVNAATGGDSPDADGYVLTVDGAERGVLTGAGSLSIAGLIPGDHLIGLSGVAANCVVEGGNPRTVTIAAGETPAVAFTVVCAAPPASAGTLRVVTSTTGPDQDPDGYSFAVDGGAGQPIAVSASASVPNLAAGAHGVRLSGLAGNCTVQGDNPRAVTVSAGATAEASFTIACTATNGSIRVAVTTSGSPTDPDGYTIKVDDHNPGQAIATNGSATLTGISAGKHTVTLTGVASNCSVTDGASREATVTAGATAELSLTVTCSPTTGSLKVSASTTGEPMDADGYSILVNGEAGGPVGSNGDVTLQNLAPGMYSVLLTGIADSCKVQGENPRSQDVTAGSTAEIAFTVTCGQAAVNGYVRTELDFLPVAINNQGHIAGTRGLHVVLWRNGVVTDLGTLGGKTNVVTGLNNHDVVVGTYAPENSPSRGFLWDGTVHDLGPDFIPWGGINDVGEMAGFDAQARGVFRKGDVSVPMDCSPHSINNRGEATGSYQYETPQGGEENHACTWDGVLRDLGYIDKGTATDINDSSTVVGLFDNSNTYDALIWVGGSRTQLQSLGGSASASAVNNTGVVVGRSDEVFNSDVDLAHPVVWKSNGILRLHEEFGEARDVNDGGQIVGIISKDRSVGSYRGVLWTPSN
ncbi:MAG TPA: hypothetical protein VGP44_06460, partial [Gemmatimonadales bacterium]|nr:hypothetical protein [Gemmatimonadales bacterium]